MGQTFARQDSSAVDMGAICRRLAENRPDFVTLALVEERIHDGCIKELAVALKSNRTVTELNLEGNYIDDEGAVVLAEGLEHNTTVETLDLGCNMIGKEGVLAIAKLLKTNKTLKKLNLIFNSIGDEGAVILARELEHNSSLQVLNVSANCIGDEGATAFAKMLRINHGLKRINLAGNCFVGDSGKRELVNGLRHNFFLEYFDEFDVDDAESALGLSLQAETNYYRSLNRAGRRFLRENNAPPALWAMLLAKAGNDLDVLYYLVGQKPELFLLFS